MLYEACHSANRGQHFTKSLENHKTVFLAKYGNTKTDASPSIFLHLTNKYDISCEEDQ